MIYYNLNTINDWNFGDDNIIKVYRNNAICYYKIDSSSPSGQTPCFAVVNDITQYTDTEFEDVFNKADGKWYKLNNLDEYEEYGVYGSGRTSCEGSTSRLPQGYTEVEYVENTSTSCIDSGFKPNQDTRIIFTAQTVTSQSSGKLIGAGSFNQTNAIQLVYEPSSTGSLNISWGTVAGWTTYSSCVGDYNVHTYDWNKNEFYRDDTLVGSVTYANFQCTYNMGIFRHIDAYSYANAAYFKGKMFALKIYDNGTLVRDMIPCQRDSDSKYGMYDIVNDTFYSSITNAQLTGGNSIGDCVTTYEGKLTIDDGYEYQYSGSSWVNVGEISGSTATLPDVPFMLNYNAKDYNSSTHSIAKTSGQTRDVDAVCNYGYHIVDHSADGYISVTGNSRMLISGTTYMGRNNTETGCTMTIVSKVRTSSGYSILTNRGRAGRPEMNWMWRYPTDGIFLHGSSSYNNPQYFTNTSTSPIVASVRTYYDGGVKQTLNDWTNNGSYSGNFGYGDNYNGNSALFCDYASSNIEFWQGDFYWVYMSQDVLTDAQIQQVIAYNEVGGGEIEYPIYYDEIQNPPDNLSFSSMTEAEEYECPWVGMKATIDGDNYVFSGDSQSGYEWVEVVLPYDAEIEYLESSGSQYINTNQYLNTSNFEIGYSVLGNRGHWGYVHNNVVNGAWVTVDETTAFFGSWNNTDKVSVSSYISSTENTIVYTQSGATINGTTISKNFNLRGVDNLASVPLLFFALHDFYNNSLIYSNSKFKSFYLKNNGTLVVDMIPVRVGQVGYMYDRVSGQLFGNAGTGSFILGPDK